MNSKAQIKTSAEVNSLGEIFLDMKISPYWVDEIQEPAQTACLKTAAEFVDAMESLCSEERDLIQNFDREIDQKHPKGEVLEQVQLIASINVIGNDINCLLNIHPGDPDVLNNDRLKMVGAEIFNRAVGGLQEVFPERVHLSTV